MKLTGSDTQCLNNVLDEIMLWLPINVLAALGMTCRLFADATIGPLSGCSHGGPCTERHHVSLIL